MFRFLFSLLSFPVMFFCNNLSLLDCFNNAPLLKAYSDGQELLMDEQALQEFGKLLSDALQESVEMPAFCVSIHDQTLESFNMGIWVRFIYFQPQVHKNMPYDELLIKIEKDTFGLNVIRGNFGRMEGRCFFLNLKNNFNQLYDYLNSLDFVENQQETSPLENDKNEDLKENENLVDEEKSILKVNIQSNVK